MRPSGPGWTPLSKPTTDFFTRHAARRCARAILPATDRNRSRPQPPGLFHRRSSVESFGVESDDADGMTMTEGRPSGAEAPTDGTHPTRESSTDAGGRGAAKSPAVPYRNEIVVVGELIAPVEPRCRTDGREVLTFRVAVRAPTTSPGADSRAPDAGEGGAAGRRDTLDCVVISTAMRRRLELYHPGDIVELSGALRHRFWSTAGRVQSRYEIEVSSLKRRTRERLPRTRADPGTGRTRRMPSR